jgi:ethanolamine utilization protein EutA
MNIDIGGGTSKIAICSRGEIETLTAIEIGARLICLDALGRVSRIEPVAQGLADAFGVIIGNVPPDGSLAAIAAKLALYLFEACGGSPMSAQASALLRLPPLVIGKPPDQISFSGGVAEYVHGRESRRFGDLGPFLADAVLTLMRGWGPTIRFADAGIRATVVGASQYTVQLSGNTIFVEPFSILPLHNLPVIVPALPWGDVVEADEVADAIAGSLSILGESGPVALGYRWQGDASHARILAFCEGIHRALSGPLVLVGERDVGGLIGAQLRAITNGKAIVSIDRISVRELDYIDIGELLQVSGGVPVVVKSLVF